MTAKLIIRLHANRLFDWLLTDNNQVITEAYQQTELQLPENLLNTAIILLVPSADVTLLNVKIPKMNRAQLLRALPYAIEERLCEDIEQLHFVAGQWQQIEGEELLAVAVTSHQKMTEWLTLCETAGLKPHQIIPDVLALPYIPEQWTCAVESAAILIRTSQQAGMTIDINNAELILNKLLKDKKPNAIVVEDYNNSSFTHLFTNFTAVEVKINAKPKSFLWNAISSTDNAINLLQGTYKSAAKAFKLSADWRFSVQLAIAALILIIMTEIVSYVSLKMENTKLQTQISALSQPLMLNQSIDSSAKPRVERELHLLAQLGKGNKFLSLLNQVGATLKQAPNIQLEQINYQNNLLILRVNANNKQAIKDWVASLRGTTINIVRINMNIQNQANTAELIFKGA